MCNNNRIVSPQPTFSDETVSNDGLDAFGCASSQQVPSTLKRTGLSSLLLTSLDFTDNASSSRSTLDSDCTSLLESREMSDLNCDDNRWGQQSQLQYEQEQPRLKRSWGSHNLTSLSYGGFTPCVSSNSVTMKNSKSRSSSAGTLTTFDDYSDSCNDLDIGNEMEMEVDSWGYFVDATSHTQDRMGQ